MATANRALWAWSSCLAGLLLLAPARALARVPGLSLTWQAPAECPDAAEVERTIQRLLGERGRRPTAVAIEAVVVVEHDGPGRFRAQVTTRGDTIGSRTLDGGSCTAIAMASAVVIALAIEPGAAAPRREPEPEPKPKPEPKPAKPAIVPPWVPYTSLVAGAVLGSLPGVVPELGFGAGLRRGRLEGELRIAFAPPSTTRTGTAGAGARVNRWSVTGAGCFAVIATLPNTSGVCLGAEVERMFAEAVGVARPGSDSVVLVSPVVALKSETRLSSRLSLLLAVTGTIRPFHPRFVVDHKQPVYSIPVVGGSLLGGLQLAF